MTIAGWLFSPRTRLDVVGGVVDGILTTLTLTAARLLGPAAQPIDLSLALRVSAAAGLTTVFVFFLAHYAQLRAQLLRAERQLNVLRHGRLFQSHLGREVLAEALGGAVLAAACSVLGALAPMLLVLIVPGPAWIGCVMAILVLAGLGAVLARSFYGSPLAWALALLIAGAVMTALGFELSIVG